MKRLTSVLFLPGLLCDASLWRAQIEDLRDIAAPAIADLTLDDTVAAMADRALAAAPESFALVALSMGGYVAFEMLRQAPERVTRLALLDTSAREDSAARRRERADAIVALEAGRFLGVTDRLLPQLIHQTHVHGPVGDQVKAMAARVGRDAFIRQQCAILGRGNNRDLLARITIPARTSARCVPTSSAIGRRPH
jgi:pimeloyl-ACP methyl ester carboxylesterase